MFVVLQPDAVIDVHLVGAFNVSNTMLAVTELAFGVRSPIRFGMFLNGATNPLSAC